MTPPTKNPPLTLPTVHMNGTGKQMLLDGYEAAHNKLRELTKSLGQIEFNARDYYPQEVGAWDKALSERQAIYQTLATVEEYLMKHMIHIQDA
jgi:hypothetical protein